MSSAIMYIMRGVPGSGKSTRVQELRSKHVSMGESVVVCSADLFFINESGDYDFHASLLSQAHSSSYDAAVCACVAGSHVIIDNTNINRKDWIKYSNLAKEYGYEVQLIQLPAITVDEAVARNIHNVPRETLIRMVKNYKHETL